MANETLILGDNNWAVKTSNLLGYAVGETSGDYVPREFTFSRNSTATYIGSNGFIQSVAANIARVQDGSLLLEPQRTNLLLMSESFNDSNWIKGTGVSVVTDSAISPRGSQDADTVTFTSGGAADFLRQSRQFLSGTTYTISVYARSISGSTSMSFDIDNAISNNFTITNQWTRYTWTVTPAATYTWVDIQFSGAAVVDIWGAQVEVGSYATTYIPTTSATATRLADVCNKTNIGSLIGQSEGVLYAEVNLVNKVDGMILQISADDNNRIGLFYRGSTNDLQVFSRNGGVFTVTINVQRQLGVYKIALAYKLDDYAFFINGEKVGTDTSSAVPACSVLDIGGYNNAFNISNFIKNATISNIRLTDEELILKTTL